MQRVLKVDWLIPRCEAGVFGDSQKPQARMTGGPSPKSKNSSSEREAPREGFSNLYLSSTSGFSSVALIVLPAPVCRFFFASTERSGSSIAASTVGRSKGATIQFPQKSRLLPQLPHPSPERFGSHPNSPFDWQSPCISPVAAVVDGRFQGISFGL